MSRPEPGGDGHSAVSVLELRDVSKTYGQEPAAVHALAGVDLSVRAGEMVAVMGPSGSGKSTLLTIAGSLEDPTSGEVLVCGTALAGMPRGRKARLRRRVIGYVFQDFNLLPGLTAAENVALPGDRGAVLRGLRAPCHARGGVPGTHPRRDRVSRGTGGHAMTSPTITPQRASGPAGQDGFGHLVRAEWTKFRTVRGWVSSGSWSRRR
jgi:ABC transporter